MYTPLLSVFNLETLEKLLDLYYAYKLVIEKIDCPEFLGGAFFFVLIRSTRTKNTFYLNIEVNNYANNTSRNRIVKTINELNIVTLSSLFQNLL